MTPHTNEGLKRATDIVASAVGLVITAPIQALIAVLIRLRLGAPVLFRQERPGKDEQLFTLIKFRTMIEPDANTGRVSDAERMTNLGKFLRSTSLDELPTLWNVLRGDMSFVGPRPLLPEYLALYTPRQATRHRVRPGITGLAQVSGRNHLDWPTRLELDAKYVEQRSLALDLWLILRTLGSVLKRTGVNHKHHATMPRFRGTGPSDVPKDPS